MPPAMTETDDIVARLGFLCSPGAEAMLEGERLTALVVAGQEAAAHITRLEERCAAYKGQVEAGAAEIERVAKERDEALANHQWAEARLDASEARADALQAEVVRLRAALERISDWIQRDLPIPTYAATTMLGVVLAALQHQEPKP